MNLCLTTLKKRIDNATTWRDVREIFYKVKAGWRVKYAPFFLDYIERTLPTLTSKSEIESLEIMRENVKNCPESDTKRTSRKIKINLSKPHNDSISLDIEFRTASNVLKNLEHMAIIRALIHTRDNREEAARLLGISERTLYMKVKAISKGEE